MKRVIVVGTHLMRTGAPVYKALGETYLDLGPFTLVHGACTTGAARFAREWFAVVRHVLTVEEVKYKADWDTFGKFAGPRRNKRMVDAGADLMLAFPHPSGSGTQGAMELARGAGIEVRELSWHG